MSRPGSHVSVSRTDVSSHVLVAGTGRDIPALSRPVPGFSNDHMTADLNREKFNLHLSQWRVVLCVVLRFSARREASLLYTTVAGS